MNCIREQEQFSIYLVSTRDHSTEDFYNNAEEALVKLVDADDRLETLEKYFKQ